MTGKHKMTRLLLPLALLLVAGCLAQASPNAIAECRASCTAAGMLVLAVGQFNGYGDNCLCTDLRAAPLDGGRP